MEAGRSGCTRQAMQPLYHRLIELEGCRQPAQVILFCQCVDLGGDECCQINLRCDLGSLHRCTQSFKIDRLGDLAPDQLPLFISGVLWAHLPEDLFHLLRIDVAVRLRRADNCLQDKTLGLRSCQGIDHH